MHGVALLFIVAITAFPMTLARAAPACEDNANLNTLQINECLFAKFETRDKELNRVYQEIQKEFAKRSNEGDTSITTASKSLLSAQRAWIPFRDGECEARYAYYSEGSIRNMIFLECKIELTDDRIKTLQWWLDTFAH